jgi:DNA repair protein RecO (recombination protein O)
VSMVERRQRTYSDRAIVLRGWPLREADRIVELFTRQSGRVRAVAKGARRAKTKYASFFQLGAELDVTIWRGKELGTIVHAELLNSYLMENPSSEAVFDGSRLLEVVTHLVPENQESIAVYDLVNTGLRMIAHERSPFLLGALLLRLLQLEGYCPSLDRCAKCNSVAELVELDTVHFRAFCPSCAVQGRNDRDLVAVMQKLIAGSTRQVLAMRDENLAARFANTMHGYVVQIVGRDLKSDKASDQSGTFRGLPSIGEGSIF